MSCRDAVRRWTGPRPLLALLLVALLLEPRPGAAQGGDGGLADRGQGGRGGAAQRGRLQGAVNGGDAGREAASGTAAAAAPPCPLDQRPDHCPAWSRTGECLRNPTFMRAYCAASCKVVPGCSANYASSPWPGHATPAGTARFARGADAAAAAHFRQHAARRAGTPAPEAALTLSSLGVGTYLGAGDDATDEAVTTAVLKSVSSGWNVIDTAANYRGGRAETAVGSALRALRMLGDGEREELFIATKAGYPSEGLLEQALREGVVQPGDVVNGAHSMHPAFLSASLERSLAELGVATVDLLYLHNPAEAQLGHLGEREFMRRLRAAFEFCEQARALGKIRTYGLATWTCFRVPPGHPQHLSLQAVVELAREVGGAEHGFRYIQLPVSTAMPEAWSQPWQEVANGGARTRVALTAAAQQLGVGVFGSGPLMQAQLLSDAGMANAVGTLPQLGAIPDTAPRLLQLARSAPGLLSTLVGHKAPAHVEQNAKLAEVPPLDQSEFRAASAALNRRR